MRNKAKPKGKDLPRHEVVAYEQELETLMDNRARSIDDLALHDELMGGVLGMIKKDLAAGLPADRILEKYAPIAAARTVTIALTDADSGRALTASKDVLDRVHGKATERKELVHRLDKLDERQIDAIILSELESLGELSEDEG